MDLFYEQIFCFGLLLELLPNIINFDYNLNSFSVLHNNHPLHLNVYFLGYFYEDCHVC